MGLNNFDTAMMHLDERFNLLEDKFIENLLIHEEMKLLVYRRGPLVFVFNFHPTNSYTDLRVPVPDTTDYTLELDTDDKDFEGFGRVAKGMRYPLQRVECYGRNQSVLIYLPNRSAQVLAPVWAM
jgi:1,4-alpha-glucan branching enzyme